MVGTSLTIDYKLPNDATLTSISAYRKINILVYSDIDQTPLNTFNSGPFTDDSIAYSQELRFVSSASERLRHVAGLFYLNHDNGGIRYIYIGGSLANGIFNDASTKTNSYAAYVNEEFDILRDLTVAGGLRYTDEQKDGHFIQVRPNLSYNFPSLNREDTNVSWLGSLRYKLTPEITTYFTASKGFKSGGFNLDSLAAVRLTAQDLNFRPESVVNYEIGIKGSMFDRKLNFSAAAFNMDYTDKQVSQFVSTVLATTPSVQVTNAGTAQIKGAQLELSALVSDRLTVSGNIAYVDAKYTSFPNAATVAGKLIAYTGNRIERTPDTTASIGAQYTYPLPAGNLVVNGSANYTGNHFLQPDNLAYGYQKGYTLYDARVGYESNQGWSAYFWGKNIGNKSYTVYGRIFAGLNQVVFGDPRFFGIEAKYSF
jgi:iron complex outermembrane receptor protein